MLGPELRQPKVEVGRGEGADAVFVDQRQRLLDQRDRVEQRLSLAPFADCVRLRGHVTTVTGVPRRLNARCSQNEAFVQGSGGPSRNRTGVQGFAVLCVTTPPSGRERALISVFARLSNHLARSVRGQAASFISIRSQISDRASTSSRIIASVWLGPGVKRSRSVPRGTVG
jgi:hypothetical protein